MGEEKVMPEFRINGISISNEITDKFNNDLFKQQYDFMEGKNADEDLEIKIDGKSDNDVIMTYVANRGCIVDDWTIFNADVMIQIMIKYPQFVIVDRSKLPEYELDIYAKYATAHSVMAHQDLLHRSLGRVITYKNFKATIECPDKWLPIVKHFVEMFCLDTCTYIDIPKGSYIKGNELILSEYPYGYKEGMKVIENDKQMKEALRNDCMNIYLNYDCDISIKSVVYEWPDAEVFATWVIGHKCKKLCSLFKNCPYEPHIYDWDMRHITDISYLFAGAQVHDLSMLNCSSVTVGKCAFDSSSIEKAPYFDKIEYAHHMFQSTNIRNVCMINPRYVIQLIATFDGCNNLKHGFANCDFPKLESCYKCFYCCLSLKTAFIKCRFSSLETMVCCFSGCISLVNAVDNCGLPKCKHFSNTCFNNIKLESAFNNCLFNRDYVDLMRILFNCISLKKVFENAGTLRIRDDSIILRNCLSLEEINGCSFNPCYIRCVILYNCPKLKKVGDLFRHYHYPHDSVRGCPNLIFSLSMKI